MKTGKKHHITAVFLAALAGSAILILASLTAFADEKEEWVKAVSGLTDAGFQAESTLSFICSDDEDGILTMVSPLMEAFLKYGDCSAVRVVCSEIDDYSMTLTPDSKHLIQWTSPWTVKPGFHVRFVFSFGDTEVSSPDLLCINDAKDLGSLTIDLQSGSASITSERTMEYLCNTLTSLADANILSFMLSADPHIADLDYNGDEDISIGKTQIQRLSSNSIHGDFTLKANAASKDYCKKEMCDYYGTLVFRFPKAAAAPPASSGTSTASSSTAPASSGTSTPAASATASSTTAASTPAASASASSGKAAAVKAKAANPMKVKAKTVKIKYKTLKKKKKLTIARKKAVTVSKAKGKVTYKLLSVSKKKNKKYFKVNAKNGTITVKKGLKKETCKLKIRVKAAGNTGYKAKSKTVTVTIKVS